MREPISRPCCPGSNSADAADLGWVADAAGLEALEASDAARLDALQVSPLPRGTVLFSPGEAARGFAVVLAGRVEVFLIGPTGRELLLYAVEPGQSCVQSTMGLLGGEDYTGEAITTTDCQLVLIPRDLFLSLMERSAPFRTFVFGAFAARMQGVMHQLERVAFLSIEARLAGTLLARADADVVHATHQDLATAIGSAREVVSRRLDAMARRGLVSLERGQIRLENIADLTDLAEDM